MIRDAAVLKLVVNEAIKESPVISGLRGDISDIKSKLDAHSFAIDSIQGDIRVLRTNYSHQNHEITDVKQDVAVLKQDVAVLKQDVAVLKQDVAVLKQDVAVLKQDVAVLKQDVAVLKQDVAVLKQDVAVLKQDVAVLKQDVAVLKQDVAVLKQDMVFVKERLTYLGVSMEELKHQMHLILDALRPAKDRAAQVDQVFAKVDDHEYRLDAVETVIKEQNF